MTTYAGAADLTRQALRRDRVLVPVWVVLLGLLCYASAAATPGLYDTTAERVHAAEAINGNPAVVALYGPIMDPRSIGELAMTKMTVLYAVFVAILAIVLVRRHTRVEEESGRLELLAGTAVGRDAPLASALVEATVVSLVVGLVAAAMDVAGGLPVTGSLAFGASWVGTGLVATGVSAVTCQLSASARTCAAVAAAVVGVLYVLRAVGDASVGWLSWLSPFGWNTRLRAWSDPRWWVLLLDVALAVVLVAAAQLLRGRRDLGHGLVAARPGPAVGSPRLTDALALAVKVHSAALVIWTVALGCLGLVFGAIAPGVDDLLDSGDAQDVIARLGGTGAVADALAAAVLWIVALLATCFAITVIGHAAADESAGRAEEVLATATSRSRWFLAAGAVALGGALWLLAVAGLAMWAGYGAAGAGEGAHTGRLLPGALAWAPAVWLVAALAALIFAVRRIWTVVAWALPALFLALSLIGELVDLPGWVTGVSPYAHVPQMPTAPFATTPELVLTALAAAVLGAAWWRFIRRDIG